jgi:hypothetical protein
MSDLLEIVWVVKGKNDKNCGYTVHEHEKCF